MKAKSIAKAGKPVARKAMDKIESKTMEAVGRKVVRGKVGAAKKVAAHAGRAALKAGLVAGASAAAAIIIDSRRRKKREG